MKTNIVGTQFAKAEAKGIEEGSEIVISHDSANEFDDQALAVHLNDERIGYIGKTSEIYELDREKFPMNGRIIDFYIKSESDDKFKQHEVGHLVSCSIEIGEKKEKNPINEAELDPKNNVPSFNEEDVYVNFDEVPHVYTNIDTKYFLKGATTYIKKYIKEFDSEMVSKNCETYWGIPVKTIRNAWDLGRDLSANFGTGIHKALEFEDLYGNHTKPKNRERCFNIKHPVIKKIVKEFYEMYDELGFEGKVIPEALITDVENNHCALADRVLVTSWENKTCRLQDYKANHSFTTLKEVKWSDSMPLELPTTKLSKLALQLKFQAQMLEKNGWTVEGCDGFVYADGWEYHKVDMLEGFDIIKGTYQSNQKSLFPKD